MILFSKRRAFHLLGGAVVLLWIIMIGHLIKQVHFSDSVQAGGVVSNAYAVTETAAEWMEIYLKEKKIGYSMTQIIPLDKDYLIQEDIVMRLNLLGQPSVMRTFTRAVVDTRFILKNFKVRISSGIVNFTISGKVENDHIIIEAGNDGESTPQKIKLSGPPMIGSGISQIFKGKALKDGESFDFFLFDPSTMTQKQMTIQVAGSEKVFLNDRKYDAWRLETKMWGQDLVFWVDENGNVLKEKGMMGLTLVRANAEKALQDLEGEDTYDFYSMSSVPVKQNLHDVERLSFLKMKVGGLKDSGFDPGGLDGGRQKFSGEILEIRKEMLPRQAPYTLPFPDSSGEMKPFLQPEWTIQSENPMIRALAGEIAGNNSNPVSVARKLMEWVYKNVEKKPVISVPSALEVIRTKVGDCNEHAVLLVALLRAVGIPARQCVGLVYVHNRFYYHAWTEAFLESWISMDATLNQMPADVSHIKLLHGGLQEQAEIISLINKLTLEIEESR